MREILFRGKQIADGKWAYGLPCNNIYGQLGIQPITKEHCSVIHKETIGQFTGLTDKNGKPIFEGDVLRRDDVTGSVLYSDESCRFLFRWKRFDRYRPDCFKNCGLTDYAMFRDMEIIGNIHDNPELLEGE